ncbi:predicted protein [Nematostella vectensis]|uniref:TIR domain-containing protein n=1 Tax=Nematostella vectensis TaxID=45351 RepID=A8DUR5_NEMVE|nr:predicted protein [Nematostella vectensis]|eukprot:XP_001620303.1 hypothetical protein NEMVEDRAFT_v1g223246 [Nematostella vectensis]
MNNENGTEGHSPRVKSLKTSSITNDVATHEVDRNNDLETSQEGHIDDTKNGQELDDSNNNNLDVKLPETSGENTNSVDQELESQNEPSKHLEETADNEDTNAVTIKTITPRKAKKRGIFVSYSPEAGFEEKRLIAYTVKELKTDEIGFANDLWFDKDDAVSVPYSPFCYQQRLEIAEKCRAVLVFLSKSYLQSRLCQHEAKILLSRNEELEDSEGNYKQVRVFCVNYDCASIPHDLRGFEENIVDFSSECLAFRSTAEKASEIVGAFSVEMEKYAPLFGRSPPLSNKESESFAKKRVCFWNINDVQEWLHSLRIPPRFCLSFEENMVDGFLLLSLDWKGCDLERYLMVDSKVVKRKLEQQLKGILETQEKDLWFEKIRKCKVKDDSVYIIYDPTDARFSNNLKEDIKRKCPKVAMHKRLGQSKEDFLKLNGPDLGASSSVVVLMSEASATSVFVYSELLFADWLNKPFIVAMAKNSWGAMRPSVQAILGDCPAIDFESCSYHDCMDVLRYQLKPLRSMPAVILEQEFLDHMVDSIKPLKVLADNVAPSIPDNEDISTQPRVFLSYHWDVQTKVQRLAHFLENQGFECWTDVSGVSKQPLPNTSLHGNNDTGTLQTQIKRSMKSSVAILCCITRKYICSDNCLKDLDLAELLSKPIVPLIFEWPLEFAREKEKVRKILAPLPSIDLSNDKQFKRNQTTLMTQLRKHAARHTSLSPRDGAHS